MSEEVEVKEGRIEPGDVVRGEIEEVESGIGRLIARRDQIDAETAELAKERDEVEATIKDAGKKITRLRNAEQLLDEAAELAPTLRADELKPSAGGSSVPPTDEPPAPSPAASSNGAGPLPEDADLQQPPAKAPIAAEIKKAMTGGEWMSQAEIRVLMPDGTSVNSMRFALQGLVKDGAVEAKGERRWRRYRVKTTRTPATPAAERKAPPSSADAGRGAPPTPRQEPTDEGRVLSALTGEQLDIAQLSIKVGIPIPKVRTILSKLMREGDVRVKRGEPVEYSATL